MKVREGLWWKRARGHVRKRVRPAGSVLLAGWEWGEGRAQGNQDLDHSVNFPLQLPEGEKEGWRPVQLTFFLRVERAFQVRVLYLGESHKLLDSVVLPLLLLITSKWEAGARSGINWPFGEVKKSGMSGATDWVHKPAREFKEVQVGWD